MRKTKTIITVKNSFAALAVLILVVGSSSGLSAQSVNDIQRQIDAVNNEIDRSQDRINNLRQRTDTLENRLAILNAEAEQLQGRIDVTQREVDRTRAQIEETEEELARLRELIQENAKTLYKQGNPSTVEVLFSSGNFSEFISKQEYLNSVKDSMEEAAEKSMQLKEQLAEKEEELVERSNRLQGQRQQLAEKQNEQQRLIDETRGEERRYQRMVDDQHSELERLEREQRLAYAAAAAAARSSGQFVDFTGTDSYPWASGPYPCWSSGCVDPWGLYYRECVSYTAWKVASTGRFVPHFGGAGHARQWPDTASRHGIQSGSTPVAGSVAISYLGVWGHSMYVEAVLDNGMIHISEYNFLPGQYTERIIPADGLTFVYF